MDGISGSGPSIFALSKGRSIAEKAGQKMKEAFLKLDIESNVYISGINTQGPFVMSQ